MSTATPPCRAQDIPITEVVTTRECDLCGLGCGKYPLQQKIGDTDHFFCCMGCMNVYVILLESGLVKDGQDLRQTELFQKSLRLGLISNQNPATDVPATAPSPDQPPEELLLHVSGMWCTSCAWLIEHAVAGLPGITRAEASFASDLVKVCYQPQALPRERIVERIQNLGYKAEEYSSDNDSYSAENRDLLIRTGLAAFLWINIMSFSLVLYAGYFEQISGSIRRGLPFVLMVLAAPVVFYCAQPILRLAWRGFLNRAIRMEALLALGIIAAYAYSVVQTFRGEIHLYFDTATAIVTLVLAGKLIERNAKEKASRWIALLHRMLPNKVRLLAKGVERFVSVDALEPDQVFVVKAGERVPADGVVIEGESHADESLLSGESTPVRKHSGDPVVAGSINLDGPVHVRASRSANESTLSRIIAQVEHALGSRSQLERSVDRIARLFVPCVVVIAILTFTFLWLTGTENIGPALMRSITVLVIACPCALGMATPLAITAALGWASAHGVLVRDSRVLETLRRVDTLILDKTGTVTEGKFSLLGFAARHHEPEHALAIAGPDANLQFSNTLTLPERAAADLDAEILSVLASLEQYSEHPLGRAALDYARKQAARLIDSTSIEIHKGHGITGMVERRNAFVGNRRLLRRIGVTLDDNLDHRARTWEAEGKTVSFLGWDAEVHAVVAFGDRIKPESVSLIRRLREAGIEVRLVSGDSAATTEWTASQLGIHSFRSDAVPEEKAEVVRDLQQSGAVVAVAGDGINDAPALAQADLGIAMASGTDIAMKAAAVVLMNGDLSRILDVFALSQKTIRVIRQNLFWAFFYNTIGITLAVAGVLNPIMAAFAMLLSSLSVVGNSMRLTRRAL